MVNEPSTVLRLKGKICTKSPVRIGAGSFKNEREWRKWLQSHPDLKTKEQKRSKYRFPGIEKLDVYAKKLDCKKPDSIIPIMKQYHHDKGDYVLVIPGSSLKGAIREYLTKIGDLLWMENSKEIVDSLFGAIENSAGKANKHRLWVGDIFFSPHMINEKTISPVDRYTRIVKAPLKEIFIEPGASAEVELLIEDVKIKDIALLALLERDWEKRIRIGAAKSRGYGASSFIPEEITIQHFSKETPKELSKINSLNFKSLALGQNAVIKKKNIPRLFEECLGYLQKECGVL